VDEAAHEVVIALTGGAAIPDGEALRGATLQFSNPGYSRNTAYHVDHITRAGNRVRIGVREATFLLGKAVVDGPPLDAQTLMTVVPHAYTQPVTRGAVTPDADFFAGKLLTTADGAASTTIRRIMSGQPATIVVDSTEGFTEGAECYYHDVQPGDTMTIHVTVSLQRSTDGAYVLRANAPVTLTAAGGEAQTTAADEAAKGVEVRLK